MTHNITVLSIFLTIKIEEAQGALAHMSSNCWWLLLGHLCGPPQGHMSSRRLGSLREYSKRKEAEAERL
jgi:hypothetical protein